MTTLARNLRVEGQDERRRMTLTRQSQNRKDAIMKARMLAMAEEVDTSQPKKTKKKTTSKTEALYSSQFQIPEWMLRVPDDLCGEEWMVMAKPEGARCLVTAFNGTTGSRTRDGKILHRFKSGLPGGNLHSSRQEFTTLECIFYEPHQTYYVMDVISWRGMSMHESSVDFRFFWCQSKIEDAGVELATINPNNDFLFRSLESYFCNLEGISNVYSAPTPYIKDGLLFYYKNAYYEPGLTPLVLAWKDNTVSRYPIDAPDGQTPYKIQECTLRVSQLVPEVVLKAFGNDRVIVKELVGPSDVQVGDIIRFELHGKVESLYENNNMNDLALEVVAIEKLVYKRKEPSHVNPDSSCRIVYQYMMRHSPLTITDISSVLR